MQTFVMLTRLAPGSLTTPQALGEIERKVMDRVRAECPEVEWVESYAVLGPYDYIDIFRAKDNDTAAKVSAIVRTLGHAHTEVWGATEWKRFKGMMKDLAA